MPEQRYKVTLDTGESYYVTTDGAPPSEADALAAIQQQRQMPQVPPLQTPQVPTAPPAPPPNPEQFETPSTMERITGSLKGLQSGLEALPTGQRLVPRMPTAQDWSPVRIQQGDLKPREANSALGGQIVGGIAANVVPWAMGPWVGGGVNAAYAAEAERNRQYEQQPPGTSLNAPGNLAGQAGQAGVAALLARYMPQVSQRAGVLPRLVGGGVKGAAIGAAQGIPGPILQQLTDKGQIYDPQAILDSMELNAAIMGGAHGVMSGAFGGPKAPAEVPPEAPVKPPDKGPLETEANEPQQIRLPFDQQLPLNRPFPQMPGRQPELPGLEGFPSGWRKGGPGAPPPPEAEPQTPEYRDSPYDQRGQFPKGVYSTIGDEDGKWDVTVGNPGERRTVDMGGPPPGISERRWVELLKKFGGREEGFVGVRPPLDIREAAQGLNKAEFNTLINGHPTALKMLGKAYGAEGAPAEEVWRRISAWQSLKDHQTGALGVPLMSKIAGMIGGGAVGAYEDKDDPWAGALGGAAIGLTAAHLLGKTPQAVNAMRQLAQNWKASFSTYGIGPQGKQAWSALVAENATGERRNMLFSRQLDQVRGALDAAPVAVQRAFTDAYENGGVGNVPVALRPAAQAIHDTYKELYDQIKQLGGLQGVQQFDDEWLGRRWKNAGQPAPPEQALNEAAGSLSGTNQRGRGYGFTKERSLATAAEGRNQAGLTPAFENPIDQALDKVREMSRWITEQSARKVLQNEGLIVRKAPGAREPNGWVPDPRDPYRQTFIHPGAAEALETWRSQGMGGNPIFDALKAGAQRMVMWKLAISGFHGLTTAVHAGVAKGGAAAKAAINEGDAVETIAKVLQIPTAAAEYFVKGRRFIRDVYNNPTQTPANNPELADYLTSGQKVGLDDYYKTGSIAKFKGNVAKAGGGAQGVADAIVSHPLNAGAAALEAPTRALMGKFVQPIKTGIQLERNAQNRAALPQGAAPRVVRKALQEGGAATDDIMGMMNYRNVQMPRALKDLAMVGTTAPGWNYGTARMIGGGAKDLATMPLRKDQGLPLLSDRAASAAIGLPLSVAAMNAIYQYAKTGQLPQQIKDLLWARTGETNKEGNPERVVLPNYLSRDVASFAHDPLGTLGSKGNPGPEELGQLIANKDWRGTQIYDEGAPALDKAKQAGKYLLEQNLPISAQYAKRYLPEALQKFIQSPSRERVLNTPTEKAESLFGIQAAPGWVTRDPAIQRAMELQNRHFPQTRTLAEQEKIDAKKEGRAALRSGDSEAIASQIQNEQLRPQDVLNMAKSLPTATRLQSLVRGLTPEEVLDVWGHAGPDEKKVLRMELMKKVLKASPSTRDRIVAALREQQ